MTLRLFCWIFITFVIKLLTIIGLKKSNKKTLMRLLVARQKVLSILQKKPFPFQ